MEKEKEEEIEKLTTRSLVSQLHLETRVDEQQETKGKRLSRRVTVSHLSSGKPLNATTATATATLSNRPSDNNHQRQ